MQTLKNLSRFDDVDVILIKRSMNVLYPQIRGDPEEPLQENTAYL